MKYNKLVRDKIPEVIRKKGGTPVTHIADLLEVIAAIADYKEFDPDEIAKIRAKKAEERGRFRERIILDES